MARVLNCMVFDYICVMNWADYIVSNPEVMFGKPVVKGTRIPVDLLLEKLGAGETTEQLLKSYPTLSIKAIQSCLLFAADNVKSIITYRAA